MEVGTINQLVQAAVCLLGPVAVSPRGLAVDFPLGLVAGGQQDLVVVSLRDQAVVYPLDLVAVYQPDPVAGSQQAQAADYLLALAAAFRPAPAEDSRPAPRVFKSDLSVADKAELARVMRVTGC